MHARDQDVLILRPVKDSDVPFGRHFLVNAPQKILLEFLLAWGFKGGDAAALRVHAGHDMLDRAVLSARVHALKNDQQGARAVSIQPFLQLIELGNVLGRSGFGFGLPGLALFVGTGIVGIKPGLMRYLSMSLLLPEFLCSTRDHGPREPVGDQTSRIHVQGKISF